MKKLMMSLLAVLLGIGFCWADGVKVSGTVTHDTHSGEVNSNNWTNATIKLMSGETESYSATVGDINATEDNPNAQYGVYTIENVAAGTYKIVFSGSAEGRDFTYEEDNFVVENDAITKDFKAILDASITMVVTVGYETEYYGTTQVKGIANATVTVTQNGTEIGTANTTDGWDAGKATFNNIKAGEEYTITATATGYKTATQTVTAAERVTVLMEEQFVTLSGTLKVKVGENGTETALAALPEGMTLTVGANGTGYSAEISETGYTVQCKSGEVKVGVVDQLGNTWESAFYKNLADNYTVSTPENGSFTIADGETATQNIVLTKTAANVIGVDKSDKLLDNQLTLTKPGTGDNAEDVVYKASFLASPYPSNHFRFNNVAPGTYTLACTKFGYKLKEDVSTTVTVSETLADVTLPEIDIEELDEVECAFTGTLQYYGANYSYIYVENAAVALYPKGETTGEPLATATSDAQGKYTVKVTGKLNTQYTLKITHASIMPIEQNVTANNATVSVYGTVYVLLASGKVNYAGDIASGKIDLLDATGYSTYATCNYDPVTGAYTIGKSSVVSGSHTITFAGQDGDKFVVEASESVDLTTVPVTKDLTATKNENKGYMTIRLKYQNSKGTIFPLSQYQFTLDGNSYTYTDGDGNYVSEQPVEKGTTHTIALAKNTNFGYDAISLGGVNSFVEINGNMRPNDTTIFVPGLEARLVKITGTIAGADKLGADVKIGLQTLRDKEVMTATIAPTGAYEFENVPVAARGAMPVFLAEAGAKYDARYGVDVPYNYGLTLNGINVSPDADDMGDEITQDLTAVKIGCNVSGTVTPAREGEISVTAQGATAPIAFADIMAGAYKFQGVPAGTYTAEIKCPGYETKTAEITVAETLEDVTVPAITLTAKAETIIVSGDIHAYNKATREDFDGAVLQIWNSASTEKLVEVTMPAGSAGFIPSDDFRFSATLGTKVIFKMTHPSIKPVSHEYTVNSTNLNIYPADLNYEFVNEGADFVAPTDFKAEWNADQKLALSWGWPADAAEAKIQRMFLYRRLTSEASTAYEQVKSWQSSDITDGLPVAFIDTVTQAKDYTYKFEIYYLLIPTHNATYRADMRDGTKYTLAYTVNDDKMGTITSYQPEGEYMEEDLIALTARANEGYKFVKFLKNDKDLPESETITRIGDTLAYYTFKMPAENVTIKAVFAVANEYTVTLVSSNEAWGTVEGAGTFEEGTEITVKAVVKDADKYEFVAWKDGETEVSKDANYTFKVEKDITLTAEFKEKPANEKLESAKWSIFAENGAIVIKGLDGDRYDIFDLNGRLAGQALGTGAEIRISVTPSRLYIVRRLGADGSFDAKKIVVR